MGGAASPIGQSEARGVAGRGRWPHPEGGGEAPRGPRPRLPSPSRGRSLPRVLRPPQGAGWRAPLSRAERAEGRFIFPSSKWGQSLPPCSGLEDSRFQPRLCPPAPAAACGSQWPPPTRPASPLHSRTPPRGNRTSRYLFPLPGMQSTQLSLLLQAASRGGFGNIPRPILQNADTETRAFRGTRLKVLSWRWPGGYLPVH